MENKTKYTKREEWIIASGIWAGIGTTFIGVGVVLYPNTPITPDTWFWGVIVGIIFVGLAMIANHEANKT